MVACPTSETLGRLLVGDIPGDDGEELARHLESCAQCTQVASTLTVTDAFVGEVRTAANSPSLSPTGAGPILEQARHAAARQVAAENHHDTALALELLAKFMSPPTVPGHLGQLGHYRVVRLIGIGGMGMVLLAEDVKLQRQVALKILKPTLAGDMSARRRFLGEARAMAAVRHERVVTIHEVGGEDDLPFLAMELLEGDSLDRRLAQGETIAMADVARLGCEIAEGLAAAHERGLIHRDVKPANIWLDTSSELGRVKLLDFGLARPVHTGTVTETGCILGTPAFMSPEQAAGACVDGRGDLFSLGCVLYLVATGKVPFAGSNSLAILSALANHKPMAPHRVNPVVPRSLSDLIVRLLSKDPADRPATATAVAEELRRIGRDLREPERVKPPRSGWLTGWAAAAAVLVLAGGIIIRIQTKDGTVIEIPVPPGAKVEIVDGKGRPADAKVDPKLDINPKPAGIAKTPLDALRREDISPYELAMAGSGDPLKAPPELVAVLGDSRLKHWGTVMSLSLHPDGDRVATSANEGVRVWDTNTGEQRQFIPTAGVSDSIRTIAYSPDGKLLAYLKYVGAPINRYAHIVLADAKTGEIKASLIGHQNMVRTIQFSSDGRWLASCSNDGLMKLWDVAAAKEKWSVAPLGIFGKAREQPALDEIAFSPDSKQLAVAGNRDNPRNAKLPGVPKDDATVILDVETGKEVKVLPQRSEYLAWSHDGKYVACQLNQWRVQIWDTTKWELASTITATPGNEISYRALAFHPKDSDLLVIAGTHQFEGGFHVWSISKRAMLRSERAVGISNVALALAFRPDGKVVGFGGPGGVYLYDTATWKPLPPPGTTLRGNVNDLALSSDGRHVYAGGSDGVLRRWDLAGSLARHEVVDSMPFTIRLVRLDPAGRFLTLGNTFSHTYRLDLTTTPAKRVTALPHRVMDASSDGKRFLRLVDTNLVVLNERGEQLSQIQIGKMSGQWTTYAISPNGDRVVRQMRDAVTVWDSATGHPGGEIKPDTVDDTASVGFSPDGKWLACRAGLSLYLADGTPLARRHRLNQSATTPLHSVHAFSPDSKTIAVPNVDGRIKIWDVASGQFVREIRGGPNGWQGARLAYSADGRYLLSANGNGTIYIFRLEAAAALTKG